MTTATVNLESDNLNSYIAGETLEANRLVKYGTVENEVVYAAAITDIAIGVTTQKVASGEQVTIQTGGVVKVAATAVAIALGVQVMPGTGGMVLLAAGATAKSVGVTESASGGTLGELVRVRVKLPNLNGPANS